MTNLNDVKKTTEEVSIHEEDRKIIRVITGMEDDCNYSFRLVDYDILSDEDKESLIEDTDFSIDKDCLDSEGNPCWKFIDDLGEDLGEITSEEYMVGDYDSMCDRLESYWMDYGIIFKNDFTPEKLATFKEVE